MRLGQLARKLALRPSQIVDYLATKQIFPTEGSNARLSDEVTERVVKHFAPERLSEIMAVEEKNQEPIATAATVEEEPVITQTVEEMVMVDTTPSSVLEVTEEKPEVEVIKAPKVELSGLKVLGKIELPEPKKKTVVTESSEGTVVTTEGETEQIPSTEKKQRRPEPRANTQRRDNHPQRQARNPIAVQREEQARKEEEKKKAKLEREKEKRTQYYLQRVKTGQPTKAAKMVDEPIESLSLKEERPAPKTWFGKFLRWLNT